MAEGMALVRQTAAEHDREIDPEHYGVLIPYANGVVPEPVLAGLRARRPDLADVTELVPSNWDQLRALIGRFVDIGTSKFVVLPLTEPAGAEVPGPAVIRQPGASAGRQR